MGFIKRNFLPDPYSNPALQVGTKCSRVPAGGANSLLGGIDVAMRERSLPRDVVCLLT